MPLRSFSRPSPMALRFNENGGPYINGQPSSLAYWSGPSPSPEPDFTSLSSIISFRKAVGESHDNARATAINYRTSRRFVRKVWARLRGGETGPRRPGRRPTNPQARGIAMKYVISASLSIKKRQTAKTLRREILDILGRDVSEKHIQTSAFSSHSLLLLPPH